LGNLSNLPLSFGLSNRRPRPDKEAGKIDLASFIWWVFYSTPMGNDENVPLTLRNIGGCGLERNALVSHGAILLLGVVTGRLVHDPVKVGKNQRDPSKQARISARISHYLSTPVTSASAASSSDQASLPSYSSTVPHAACRMPHAACRKQHGAPRVSRCRVELGNLQLNERDCRLTKVEPRT
jgi:hypothetical protein